MTKQPWHLTVIHAARIVAENDPVRSKSREVSTRNTLTLALRQMESASPEARQSLCREHGLSLAELRALVEKANTRIESAPANAAKYFEVRHEDYDRRHNLGRYRWSYQRKKEME